MKKVIRYVLYSCVAIIIFIVYRNIFDFLTMEVLDLSIQAMTPAFFVFVLVYLSLILPATLLLIRYFENLYQSEMSKRYSNQ